MATLKLIEHQDGYKLYETEEILGLTDTADIDFDGLNHSRVELGADLVNAAGSALNGTGTLAVTVQKRVSDRASESAGTIDFASHANLDWSGSTSNIRCVPTSLAGTGVVGYRIRIATQRS